MSLKYYFGSQVNVTLKLSEDERQHKVLTADLSFMVPAKLLVFAWMDGNLWWSKSERWSTKYQWRATYYQAAPGWFDLVIRCEGTPTELSLWYGHSSNSCWLTDIQDIPFGHEPDAVATAEVEFLKPAVFHWRAGHGVGLIAVPHGAAKTLRDRIWRLKQPQMNESLEPFAMALFKTRTGRVKGFVPNITFNGTAYGSQ